MVKSICVFCGASNSIDSKYINEGKKFGEFLASQNIRLIYGGGDSGVMGAVANGILKSGGKVTGVFPKFLSQYESEHKNLTEMILVEDMHTRKWRMFELTDAFVIFPGGFGTMDETFEVITWRQLGVHNKPIIIYNQEGYWNAWVELTKNIISQNFARKESENLYKVVTNMNDILPSIKRELEG